MGCRAHQQTDPSSLDSCSGQFGKEKGRIGIVFDNLGKKEVPYRVSQPN
jgi:hypothetical protein